MLQNVLTAFEKSEQGYLPQMTSPTTKLGEDIPRAWLCCFKKNEATIAGAKQIVCLTKVKIAKERLNQWLANRVSLIALPSKVNLTVLAEFEETLNWLNHFNDYTLIEMELKDNLFSASELGECNPYPDLATLSPMLYRIVYHGQEALLEHCNRIDSEKFQALVKDTIMQFEQYECREADIDDIVNLLILSGFTKREVVTEVKF